MTDSRDGKGEAPEWNWETATKSAVLIGLSLEQFDDMTPYELSLSLEAYNERKEAELQEKLTLVWMNEYYHRMKKLPSLKSELKKLLPDSGQKKVMTDEQMLENVKRLNALFGGTVQKANDFEK